MCCKNLNVNLNTSIEENIKERPLFSLRAPGMQRCLKRNQIQTFLKHSINNK